MMNFIPKHARFILAALVFAALAATLSTQVYGRAGGGHGFSGGGGHSGGFGGGHTGGGGGFGGGGFHGGGGGGGIPIPIPLDAQSLLTVLIVIAVVIAVLVIMNRVQQQQQADMIRRGREAVDRRHHDEAVQEIVAQDAAFNEQAFCDRVKTAALKIQAGWSEQNLEPSRPFMSDGVWERFSLQIQEQRDRGMRNVVENVQVSVVLLVEFVARGPHDSVAVRIDATANDYDVLLKDGSRLAGPRRNGEFAEYWTFVRRRGAKSLADKPGLIEGCCPNCGANLEMNQSAKCPSCGSLIRSGEYDWVLAEITQECEWAYSQEQDLPGVEDFVKTSDAEFSAAPIEDRASVMFWRKAMADRLADAKFLAKVAVPEFCEAFAKQLPAAGGERTFTGDCAVGSVWLKGVAAGDPLDRAIVQIDWSGAHFKAKPGELPAAIDISSLHQTLFVLGRRHGVKTDPGRGMSSSHCPGCGAPESDSAASACEFCGAVLNDGSLDWALLDVQPAGMGAAEQMLANWGAKTAGGDEVNEKGSGADFSGATLGRDESTRGKIDSRPPGVAAPQAVASGGSPQTPPPLAAPRDLDLMAWAATIAVSDGTLADGERAMLEETARSHGVPPATLDKLLQAAQGGTLNLPLPSSREEAQTWLAVLCNLALEDGEVATSEYNLLCRLGQTLNLSSYDIRQYLIKRKTQLYQAARSELQRQGTNGPTTAA